MIPSDSDRKTHSPCGPVADIRLSTRNRRDSIQAGANLAEILASARLPALDGLRAVAVFTVIVYHFGFVVVPGDLGVNAFFVLSGFLITWLLLQEYGRTGQVELGKFYLRRTLRIAPAYYGFLLVVYVEEQLRGYHWDPALTLAGLLYVVNYYNAFNGHPNTAIAHAWSLGVEQQFYLIWPLLLGLVIRKGTKSIASMIAIIVCVVVTWRSYAYIFLGATTSYVYNAFETRLDCLAVGCMVAVCCELPQFRVFAGAVSQWSISPFITLLVLLYSRIGGSESYHYSVGVTVDSILLAVLMVQLLVLSRRRTWSWIDHPVTVYLGRISYSLYLYHLLALGIAYRLAPAPTGARLVVSIGLCILIASLSYRLIEIPFLQWKRSSILSNTKPVGVIGSSG